MALLLIGVVGLACAAVAQARPAGQWPQWRGPDGLGVSTDANIPEQWSHDSANIKWKTRLPGEGCSSPIVSGDRVFVTTAYENRTPHVLRRVAVIATCVLTVVFFVALLTGWIGRFRDRHSSHGHGEEPSPGRTVNAVFAGITTTAFFLLLMGLYVFPRQYDATVGEVLARTLGTYDTEHLFYIGVDALAATWLNTGAVALLGLAASLYWLRARSVWRLLGGLVFVPLAAAFVVLTPLDAWKYEVFLWTRLLFVIPGGLVAAWHLLNYLEIRCVDVPEASAGREDKMPFLRSLNNVRIHWRHRHPYRFGGVFRLAPFLSLVGVAVLAFVPINLLLPRMGLRRAILGLDFETGEMLWETVAFTAPPERSHRDSSFATPTPATDGQHVVANFGVGVACVDWDGRMIWRVTDPHYLHDTLYGASASVLLWKDRTIIVQESEEKTRRHSWMAAFETASGNVVWRVQPRDLKWTYSTGLVYEDGAGTKLVIPSYREILGFDLASGQQLWKYEIPMEQIVASPARAGSLFCVGGGTWGPQGLVTFEVVEKQEQGPVKELWRVEAETPGCASPVLYNGILFTITDSGILRAYDAVSGSLHWRKRLRGRYLASLLAGDGKVYACNTNGRTTVLAAEPHLQILAQNSLQGDCRASFAVADSHLLVRTADFLYCISPGQE